MATIYKNGQPVLAFKKMEHPIDSNMPYKPTYLFKHNEPVFIYPSILKITSSNEYVSNAVVDASDDHCIYPCFAYDDMIPTNPQIYEQEYSQIINRLKLGRFYEHESELLPSGKYIYLDMSNCRLNGMKYFKTNCAYNFTENSDGTLNNYISEFFKSNIFSLSEYQDQPRVKRVRISDELHDSTHDCYKIKLGANLIIKNPNMSTMIANDEYLAIGVKGLSIYNQANSADNSGIIGLYKVKTDLHAKHLKDDYYSLTLDDFTLGQRPLFASDFHYYTNPQSGQSHKNNIGINMPFIAGIIEKYYDYENYQADTDATHRTLFSTSIDNIDLIYSESVVTELDEIPQINNPYGKEYEITINNYTIQAGYNQICIINDLNPNILYKNIQGSVLFRFIKLTNESNPDTLIIQGAEYEEYDPINLGSTELNRTGAYVDDEDRWHSVVDFTVTLQKTGCMLENTSQYVLSFTKPNWMTAGDTCNLRINILFSTI